MKLRYVVILVATFGVVFSSKQTQATVNDVESSLNLAAAASFNDFVDSDSDVDSQLTTLNPLSVDVEAIATDGTSTVRSYGDGSATWDDSAHGEVSFKAGWEVAAAASAVSLVSVGPNSDGWIYSFTTDIDSNFVLDYSVMFSGSDVSGLNGFAVFFDGVQIAPGQFDPGGSPGTVNVLTTATTLHNVQIRPGANISGDLGTRTAEMLGQFEWRILPVPEPGSLAMASLFGFSAVTLARRR